MATKESGHSPLSTPRRAEPDASKAGGSPHEPARHGRSRPQRLRDAMVLHHQRLVKSIASRFQGDGETLEDLVQVGNIGLIKALDRYDPGVGTCFSTYATPTILGEIKRHFRDKSCGIKVPRRLQELHRAARRAGQQMAKESGRTPTPSEIAARLGADEEEIVEALVSGEAMSLVSLDGYAGPHKSLDSFPLADRVGRADSALEDFERYGDLRAAMARLERREYEVIRLRYFGELSQAKIARKLGVSQMHVSRLLRRALERLHGMLADERSTSTTYS